MATQAGYDSTSAAHFLYFTPLAELLNEIIANYHVRLHSPKIAVMMKMHFFKLLLLLALKT